MVRSARSFVCVAALAAFAGACRGKPQRQDPPKNVETASGAKVVPNLDLPIGPGTPPLKTAKPLVRDDFERLSKPTYNGFDHDVHAFNDKIVEVRHTTTNFEPKIRAIVTMEPCQYHAITECKPIDLDKWKADPKLKEVIHERLRDRADTDFEVGKTDLNGTEMIFTYELGYVWPQDGKGAYMDSYALYWNDGINQIRVIAMWADDPANKETMQKRLPKEDLEKVAKSFMDVYTHAWAPTS
jgi:hypothetical protein